VRAREFVAQVDGRRQVWYTAITPEQPRIAENRALRSLESHELGSGATGVRINSSEMRELPGAIRRRPGRRRIAVRRSVRASQDQPQLGTPLERRLRPRTREAEHAPGAESGGTRSVHVPRRHAPIDRSVRLAVSREGSRR
jgi:hypothetical protein